MDKKILNKVKKLVKISKEKKIIKPHTDAYKEFPVNEEIHKGNKSAYIKWGIIWRNMILVI